MSPFKHLIFESINPYPALESDMLDSSCNTDDEFFFPNMCHVCRCFGEKAKNLKRCGACGMISYCSKEHQVKHWPSHKQICKVLCQIKKQWKVDHLFHSIKHAATKNPILATKRHTDNIKCHESLVDCEFDLTLTIIRILQRKLRKTECEMIRFPRVCCVCYETKQELLTNCKKCPQASFCKKHLNDPSHETECIKLLHCFYKSSNKKLNDAFYTLAFALDNMMTSHQPKEEILPASMLEFLDTRLPADLARMRNSTGLDEELRSIYNTFLSERYCRPLSLLFGIEKLSLDMDSMVIHVPGSFPLEQYITDWEMIMHYSPNLRELRLVLIGPDFFSDSCKIENVCKDCIKGNRKLTIETKKAFYHEYCRGESYLKPDMIVCFNPGFHVFDTWEKSIEMFKKGKCPVMVTTLQATEGILNKGMVDSAFPQAKCVYNDQNPFSGLAYQREAVHLPVASRNQFLFLYEYLVKKKSSR